ncbi:MAG: hypothetical protein KDD25_03550, partial [Bdellovibrionales bacterium]|nr:hypothetical protein [Bdellovibrionales bacterium]
DNPFLSFPPVGELDDHLKDIKVIKSEGENDYIGIYGSHGAGFSVWKFNKSTLSIEIIFQDASAIASNDLVVFERNGDTRVLAYPNVYSLTEIKRNTRCLIDLDGNGNCPGLIKVIPRSPQASGKTYFEDNGRMLIADVQRVRGLEIGIVNESDFSSYQVIARDPRNKLGNTTFYRQSSQLKYFSVLGTSVEVVNISSCSVANPCSVAQKIEFKHEFSNVGSAPLRAPTVSQNESGRVFGYVSSFGPLERLFDITDASDKKVFDVTGTGSRLNDPNCGLELNYWNYRSQFSFFGNNHMISVSGKWHRNVFYRTSGTVLDAHHFVNP